MTRNRLITGSLLAAFAAFALGATPASTQPAPVVTITPLESGPVDVGPAFNPIVSHSDGEWVVPMLFVITGIFAVAAIVGPIVHEEMSQSIPPVQTFDEPPGTSGHHGPTGTIDLHPPEHPHSNKT